MSRDIRTMHIGHTVLAKRVYLTSMDTYILGNMMGHLPHTYTFFSNSHLSQHPITSSVFAVETRMLISLFMALTHILSPLLSK
jgi:hypothetical protein